MVNYNLMKVFLYSRVCDLTYLLQFREVRGNDVFQNSSFLLEIEGSYEFIFWEKVYLFKICIYIQGYLLDYFFYFLSFNSLDNS